MGESMKKAAMFIAELIPKLLTKSGVKLAKNNLVYLYLLIPGPYYFLNEWSEARYWKKTSQTLPSWMDSTPLPNFVSTKVEVLLLVSAVAASFAALWSLLGFIWCAIRKVSLKRAEGEVEEPISWAYTLRGLLSVLAYQALATFTLVYTDPGKFNNIGFIPKEIMPYVPFKTYPSNFTHVGLLGLCLVFFHVNFAQYRPYLVILVCELIDPLPSHTF